MRQRLNQLVLDGQKRATAGLLSDYGDEPLENVGERLVLVDDDTEPIGLVEVVRTGLTTFAEVPWEFAASEAEGDHTIEEWRAGHRRFWESEGIAVTNDLEVYLIWFTLIERQPRMPSDL